MRAINAFHENFTLMYLAIFFLHLVIMLPTAMVTMLSTVIRIPPYQTHCRAVLLDVLTVNCVFSVVLALYMLATPRLRIAWLDAFFYNHPLAFILCWGLVYAVVLLGFFTTVVLDVLAFIENRRQPPQPA